MSAVEKTKKPELPVRAAGAIRPHHFANMRWATSKSSAKPVHACASLCTPKLPHPFQDAHVIGDGGAAHIEDAAEARALDLHVAGSAGELHGGEDVHGDAGRADRMALRLQPARRID